MSSIVGLSPETIDTVRHRGIPSVKIRSQSLARVVATLLRFLYLFHHASSSPTGAISRTKILKLDNVRTSVGEKCTLPWKFDYFGQTVTSSLPSPRQKLVEYKGGCLDGSR